MVAATNLSDVRASAKATKVRSTVTLARPDDVTAYAANDVIFQTGAAGVIQFEQVGSSGLVLGASCMMGQAVTTDLRLLIFDEEPTGFADNAALSLTLSDGDKIVGAFSMTDASKVTVAAAGRVYETAARNPAAYTADTGGKLYGLLVTPTGFTPASGVRFTVSLHLEID